MIDLLNWIAANPETSFLIWAAFTLGGAELIKATRKRP